MECQKRRQLSIYITDPGRRKLEYQIGLETLVVLAVNDDYKILENLVLKSN